MEGPMHPIVRPIFVPCLVSLFVLAAALAPPAASQAPVPALEVGDSAGYGTELDLGVLLEPYLDMIREQDAMTDNLTIAALSATGSLDVWGVSEVTGAADPTVEITTDVVVGLDFHFALDATIDALPDPGTYTGTRDPYWGLCMYPGVPTSSRRITVDLDVRYLEVDSEVALHNASDLALRESTTNASVESLVTFVATGLPRIEMNDTTCEQTVAYETLNLRATADVDAQVRSVFAPALDRFDFPLEDGDAWCANATATFGGTVAGTIDVTGLDPEDEADLFEAIHEALSGTAGVVVTGLDGFPVDLAQITVLVGGVEYLADGTIHDVSTPVSSCYVASERQMTLADGQFHTVYEIASAPLPMDPYLPPGSAPYVATYYSPDDGMVVGYALVVPSGGTADPVFELRNVSPAEARSHIGTTKDQYAIQPAAAGDPVADLFLKSPYWGILVIVAAGILVAALLLRRRRRPTSGPPAPPPPP
ncbi:MAG: hypothetical protein A3K59_04700 [Euryarchaeota archaeon RBG_19FT_COMBO_69_17]|nr:MAG: hypothetical protein A3K59_04700 [Euryarchaeota archaeon RBG_19FT_COMBO_69_17]